MSEPAPGPDRRIPDSGFADDDGAADPTVAAALAAYAADRDRYAEALAAVAGSRLLVPVVAVLGEVEHGPDGLAREKDSDMAVVLTTGSDGRRALLAFTSTAAMAAWDPAARPVPVTATLAATAALQEQASAMVVDLAGPATLVVEQAHLHRVAQGWLPARVGERTGWIRPAGEGTGSISG